MGIAIAVLTWLEVEVGGFVLCYWWCCGSLSTDLGGAGWWRLCSLSAWWQCGYCYRSTNMVGGGGWWVCSLLLVMLRVLQSQYLPGWSWMVKTVLCQHDDSVGIAIAVLTWLEVEVGGFVLCYWWCCGSLSTDLGGTGWWRPCSLLAWWQCGYCYRSTNMVGGGGWWVCSLLLVMLRQSQYWPGWSWMVKALFSVSMMTVWVLLSQY